MSRKITVTFEHQIRSATLNVEAWGMADDDGIFNNVKAWGIADDDGIFKTGISDVLLDEVSVLRLLTPDDLDEIDEAIEPAIHADAANDYGAGDRHQLGD